MQRHLLDAQAYHAQRFGRSAADVNDAAACKRPAVGDTNIDFLPVTRLRTRTSVPKGSVLCAAVSACWSYRSPLAVRRP